MKVIGLDTFGASVGKLKKALPDSVMRQALNNAIDPALIKARALAPKGSRMHRVHRRYGGQLVAPGFLSRSIIKKSSTGRRGSGPYALIKLKPQAFYGQFAASGFKTRKGRQVPGKPFLDPAVMQSRGDMRRRFFQYLDKRIAKAVAGARKRGIA